MAGGDFAVFFLVCLTVFFLKAHTERKAEAADGGSFFALQPLHREVVFFTLRVVKEIDKGLQPVAGEHKNAAGRTAQTEQLQRNFNRTVRRGKQCDKCTEEKGQSARIGAFFVLIGCV